MTAIGSEDRVARLELAARRHRTAIAALVVALVVFEFVMPFARRSTRADAFELMANGRVRAALAASPGGTPALSLYDRTGHPRLVLTMREDGSPDITMHDAGGNIRAALRISEAGVPTLLFTGQAGDVRAAMGVPTDGLPALVLLGDEKRVRYVTP